MFEIEGFNKMPYINKTINVTLLFFFLLHSSMPLKGAFMSICEITTTFKVFNSIVDMKICVEFRYDLRLNIH